MSEILRLHFRIHPEPSIAGSNLDGIMVLRIHPEPSIAESNLDGIMVFRIHPEPSWP